MADWMLVCPADRPWPPSRRQLCEPVGDPPGAELAGPELKNRGTLPIGPSRQARAHPLQQELGGAGGRGRKHAQQPVRVGGGQVRRILKLEEWVEGSGGGGVGGQVAQGVGVGVGPVPGGLEGAGHAGGEHVDVGLVDGGAGEAVAAAVVARRCSVRAWW